MEFWLAERIARVLIEFVEGTRVGAVNSRVYVETSVVAYLTAPPVRDVVTLGDQLATREWWLDAQGRFELVVSDLVLGEIAAGDPATAKDRLDSVASLPVLAFDEESAELGRHLIQSHAIPSDARQEAPHVAIAAVNGVDYLATWNLRNIANPRLIPQIYRACRDRGYAPAVICTPSQLTEADVEDSERYPIMAELRRIRAQVAAEVGNDPMALMEYAKGKEGPPPRTAADSPSTTRMHRR